MEQYKGAPLGELSPHVFAVADASYRWGCIWCVLLYLQILPYLLLANLCCKFVRFCWSWFRAMMNEGKSQSILVSGESGAGKTETTKLIMQYLTFVGGRAAGDDRTVEQQVLEVNNCWTQWIMNSEIFISKFHLLFKSIWDANFVFTWFSPIHF